MDDGREEHHLVIRVSGQEQHTVPLRSSQWLHVFGQARALLTSALRGTSQRMQGSATQTGSRLLEATADSQRKPCQRQQREESAEQARASPGAAQGSWEPRHRGMEEQQQCRSCRPRGRRDAPATWNQRTLASAPLRCGRGLAERQALGPGAWLWRCRGAGRGRSSWTRSMQQSRRACPRRRHSGCARHGVEAVQDLKCQGAAFYSRFVVGLSAAPRVITLDAVMGIRPAGSQKVPALRSDVGRSG